MRLRAARQRGSRGPRAAAQLQPRRAERAVISKLALLKSIKRQIIDRHVRPDNFKGLMTCINTLLPIAALFYAAWLSTGMSYALTLAIVLPTSLFFLRAFVLMHECGHGSLFRSGWLNRGFGFVFGVVAGMPQYVWSQHHQFHHAHNGNWARYRGPLNTAPVAEYAAMSPLQQRRYRRSRSIWLAPMAGFMYVIVYPRLTWLKGSIGLLRHLARGKLAEPGASIGALAAAFKTRYWSSMQEYRHMTWNNLVLLALWGLMSWLMGPLLFFAFYLTSASLAGGAGLLLFAVQHNFEQSYASGNEGWDYTRAAIEGTSFLSLPGWLNWFTVNIAYHHIHHLSARIPSYCLVACHDEYAQHFTDVRRIRLAQVPAALNYILWDTPTQRIVSVADFQRQGA